MDHFKRAKDNEKNCITGAMYILYGLGALGALAEPFNKYALGTPVEDEFKDRWNAIIHETADTILMCSDEIIKDGAII